MVKVDDKTLRKNAAALVTAADKVARRDGLAAATIARVAKEAGLTHGAIYKRYPNREALLAGGITAGFARMEGWVRAMPDAQAYRSWIDTTRGRSRNGHVLCPAIAHAAAIPEASHIEQEAWQAGYDALLGAMAEWPDLDTRTDARALLIWAMGEVLFPPA